MRLCALPNIDTRLRIYAYLTDNWHAPLPSSIDAIRAFAMSCVVITVVK